MIISKFGFQKYIFQKIIRRICITLRISASIPDSSWHLLSTELFKNSWTFASVFAFQSTLCCIIASFWLVWSLLTSSILLFSLISSRTSDSDSQSQDLLFLFTGTLNEFENFEIWSKFWHSVEILKFGRNFECFRLDWGDFRGQRLFKTHLYMLILHIHQFHIHQSFIFIKKVQFVHCIQSKEIFIRTFFINIWRIRSHCRIWMSGSNLVIWLIFDRIDWFDRLKI